jgi:hypothetical protein
MPIIMTCRPAEGTRTEQSTCNWVAETTAGGITLRGPMNYPSLHYMATRNIAESASTPIRQRSFSERPPALAQKAQNGGCSLPDDAQAIQETDRPV